MKKRSLLAILSLLLGLNLLSGQVDPLRYKPTSLVNDFATLFTPAQTAALERRLVDFNDSTTNVITVVTVNDLEGYPSWQLAYKIGDRWGVQHEHDGNGVVILIKPRNATDGDVAISVGYALEAVIPDILAKRIINEQMIPALKDDQYYEAVTAALDTMLPLIAGEIAYPRQKPNAGVVAGFAVLFFIGIVILVLILSKKGGNKPGASGGGKNNGGFWRALWLAGLANSGSRRGGGFGGGSGGFGGGFGGFGGSGGFGGGGASGKF